MLEVSTDLALGRRKARCPRVVSIIFLELSPGSYRGLLVIIQAYLEVWCTFWMISFMSSVTEIIDTSV